MTKLQNTLEEQLANDLDLADRYARMMDNALDRLFQAMQQPNPAEEDLAFDATTGEDKDR